MPGVTGIIGKNGSGKTTILEAIAWGLYGAPAIRGKYDTVRCRAAEGDVPVEVTLTFALGAHVYTIIRRLESSGKSTASLKIDGVPARTGFKEVSESVTKILGMDYQAFFTSFFTAQKEIEFMRGLAGRDRAKAISQMLGYERIMKSREKANQDRLALHREISGLEQGLGDPEEIKNRKLDTKGAVVSVGKLVKEAESRESTSKSEVERLKPIRDLMEEKSKRFSELTRRRDLDRAEESRASNRLNELKTELSDLDAKEKELTALKPQLDEYRSAGEAYRGMAELQKHESRRRELEGQMSAVSRDIEMLQSRIKSLSGAVCELESADKALVDLDKQIAEVDSKVSEQRESISRLRSKASAELDQIAVQFEELTEKRHKISVAGKDGKCPTCDRPLVEELPKVLAGFDGQMNKLSARAEKLRSIIESLKQEPDELKALLTMRNTLDNQRNDKRRERDDASCRKMELGTSERDFATKQKELGTLASELALVPSGFDQQRYTELREVGARLKPVYEQSIALKTALGRRDILAEDVKREESALARVHGEIQSSEKSLVELSFRQEDYDKAIASFENASASLNVAAIEAERARGDLRAAQAALDAAERDDQAYKIKEKELKERQRQRLYLQTLTDAFDALRADLNSRTVPELAATAGDLLSEMTDGRYTTLEVNEDYDAKIRDDGELKEIISGGEQDIVNLALRLAVSRMIADRAGQDLSLLVLDEVFGSLDDVRRDNLVNLLQTLKSRFEQIILITHVESIHDAIDNCIWVDYDESTKTAAIRTRAEEFDPILPV